MSNRRLQFGIPHAAVSRRAELRATQNAGYGLTLNIIVVGIILAVAIIPAQLADWIA
jgi:hypothetical protein